MDTTLMSSEIKVLADNITIEIITGKQRDELLAQAITETLIQKLTTLAIGLHIFKSSMANISVEQTAKVERLEQILKQASLFTLAAREILLTDDNKPLYIDHRYEDHPMISLDNTDS